MNTIDRDNFWDPKWHEVTVGWFISLTSKQPKTVQKQNTWIGANKPCHKGCQEQRLSQNIVQFFPKIFLILDLTLIKAQGA